MISLFPASTYLTILPDELCNAIEQGELAMSDAAIQLASEDLYGIQKKPCSGKGQDVMCLFLYTYALETYCTTGSNYLSEEQLIATLACVEQTSKSCCNG